MKILIFLIIISVVCFAQSDTSKIHIEDLCAGYNPYDEYPQLIGGIDSLQIRLIYPAEAREYEIEGNVYVLINIDTLGTPTNPYLLKGIGYGCDEEAIRLVMTAKYIAATKNGKKIGSQTSVPVKFRFTKNE